MGEVLRAVGAREGFSWDRVVGPYVARVQMPTNLPDLMSVYGEFRCTDASTDIYDIKLGGKNGLDEPVRYLHVL